MVNLKNRKARVEFAKNHIKWSKEDWKNVLFSDESKYCLFGSDGVQYIRRPINSRNWPKYQIPTMKHGGGNVMVWGCFGLSGVGPLHRIDGIMDSEMYKDILESKMIPHARKSMPRKWIFQQDNDPKHTSRLVTNFLRAKKISVMNWPSQSPDLNPIEHLWEELQRATKDIQVSNADEKFETLQQAWLNISPAKIDKLIESMPRRCKAVIDSFGYPTKY